MAKFKLGDLVCASDKCPARIRFKGARRICFVRFGDCYKYDLKNFGSHVAYAAHELIPAPVLKKKNKNSKEM